MLPRICSDVQALVKQPRASTRCKKEAMRRGSMRASGNCCGMPMPNCTVSSVAAAS